MFAVLSRQYFPVFHRPLFTIMKWGRIRIYAGEKSILQFMTSFAFPATMSLAVMISLCNSDKTIYL